MKNVLTLVGLVSLLSTGCVIRTGYDAPNHAAHPVTRNGPCANRDGERYKACMFEIYLEQRAQAKKR